MYRLSLAASNSGPLVNNAPLVRPQHEQAKDLSEDAVRSASPLYVTWDIISETLTLLRYRRSYREALTFLTEVKPHLHIVNYGEAVRTEAEQIFRRYGRDHKLSFSDAVSFVVVTTLEARNKFQTKSLRTWNLAFRNLKLFRISLFEFRI